jgi:hypothetical protein
MTVLPKKFDVAKFDEWVKAADQAFNELGDELGSYVAGTLNALAMAMKDCEALRQCNDNLRHEVASIGMLYCEAKRNYEEAATTIKDLTAEAGKRNLKLARWPHEGYYVYDEGTGKYMAPDGTFHKIANGHYFHPSHDPDGMLGMDRASVRRSIEVIRSPSRGYCVYDKMQAQYLRPDGSYTPAGDKTAWFHPNHDPNGELRDRSEEVESLQTRLRRIAEVVK